MKKNFEPMRLFIPMILLGWSCSLISCSDDDKNAPELPNGTTTEVMFGDYTGKLIVTSQSPEGAADENDETQEGTDITAHVDNDTIYFEKFPIKEIVASIVKDETIADKIVEAVGDVNYEIGYNPTLTMHQDSIRLALAPRPLMLSVAIPNSQEETATLFVEVVVEAGKEAGYAIESANLKFDFTATEILLREGEEENPLPDFAPMTFQFDMNQNKVQPVRF